MRKTTIDDSDAVRGTSDAPVPGLVVVFAGGKPTSIAIPLHRGVAVLGRDHALLPEDGRLSRRHAEVSIERERWTVRDEGSRNGTYVDGRLLTKESSGNAPKTIRVGRTLLVPTDDIGSFTSLRSMSEGDMIAGPSLRSAWSRIAHAGRLQQSVLITGESGSGKEHAARVFHEASPHRKGPFVAVNCATIPTGVAERVLFGSRRGAFSGAENAKGYVEAADGGVLFLDELGEIDLEVQAKLLRVLETREVSPLGSTTSHKVDLQVCFATHRDLRKAVAADRFRADLYHRIAQPHVPLPPLRARPEEIPWLIDRAVARVSADLAVSATYVEACILRPWPGNVRELVAAATQSASVALEKKQPEITVDHLDEHAGQLFEGEEERSTTTDGEDNAPLRTREAIEAAMKTHGGNVSAAARALDINRTHFYRLLKRFGLQP